MASHASKIRVGKMLTSEFRYFFRRGHVLARDRPDGEAARPTAGHLEASVDEHLFERLFRKTGVMGHEHIAFRQLRTMAVEDVEGGDGARGGHIGRVGKLVRDNERGNGFEVGAGDDGESVRLEHAKKFRQRARYFMRVEMLDVVRRKNGIDAFVANRFHVRHGADDIGIDGLVDVEAHLPPIWAGKGSSCMLFSS